MNTFLCAVNMTNDSKIEKLIEEFGDVALAVWVRLLSCVGKAQEYCYIVPVSPMWYKKFAAEGKTSQKTINKIFDKMAEIKLIHPDMYKDDIIFIPNFYKFHANYIKLLQKRNTFSGENILKNLENFFETHTKNKNYIIDFKTFTLILFKTCLKHGVDLRICTSNSTCTSTGLSTSTDLNNKELINNNSSTAENFCENVDNPVNCVDNVKTEQVQEQPEIEKQEEQKTEPLPPQQAESAADPLLEPEESPPPETKRKIKIFSKNNWQYQMAVKFYDLVKRRDETLPPPNLQVWAQPFDRLLREGRGRREIEGVLNYLPQNNFWGCVTVTPEDFYSKFVKLKQFSLHRPELGKTKYVYREFCEALQKHNRNRDDFVRCVDENGEEIYWDKTKGACPYKELEEDIVLLVKDFNKDEYRHWNIKKHGVDLPDGCYFKGISQGKKEYEKSKLNLKFYKNDFDYNSSKTIN